MRVKRFRVYDLHIGGMRFLPRFLYFLLVFLETGVGSKRGKHEPDHFFDLSILELPEDLLIARFRVTKSREHRQLHIAQLKLDLKRFFLTECDLVIRRKPTKNLVVVIYFLDPRLWHLH